MEQLKKFRIEKNYTQQQFAIKLNVSPSYYIKVEQGIAQPGKGFIDKFLKAFPNDYFSIIAMFYPESDNTIAANIGGDSK